MTDDTTPADTALDPAEFDIDDWLNGDIYPEKKVEVFNNMAVLAQIAELETFVKEQTKNQEANRAFLLSITEDGGSELSQAIREAQEQVDILVKSLQGTGLVFHIRGISASERNALAKSLAATFKPSAAKFGPGEDGEPVELSPAIAGGEEHPDYSPALINALGAKCILSVTNPAGVVSKDKMTVARMEKYREKMHPIEFRRLSNTIFDVNYFSYDIDEKVTLDFS